VGRIDPFHVELKDEREARKSTARSPRMAVSPLVLTAAAGKRSATTGTTSGRHDSRGCTSGALLDCRSLCSPASQARDRVLREAVKRKRCLTRHGGELEIHPARCRSQHTSDETF
jgi:hypothetical protein